MPQQKVQPVTSNILQIWISIKVVSKRYHNTDTCLYLGPQTLISYYCAQIDKHVNSTQSLETLIPQNRSLCCIKKYCGLITILTK